MQQTRSNAAILTQLGLAMKPLNMFGASLLMEAAQTGRVTLSGAQVATLVQGFGTMDNAVREALAIEVERLDLADKAQANATPSEQTVQDFLNARRANQEAVARAFSEPRDQQGFEELRGMADQPAAGFEIDGMTFHPIGSFSLPIGATPAQFEAAVAEFLSGLGRGPAPSQKH